MIGFGLFFKSFGGELGYFFLADPWEHIVTGAILGYGEYKLDM